MMPPNLNRREWLSIGAAAASGLLPSAAPGEPGHNRMRLSLNENPFGPPPFVQQEIRAHLTDLSRYAGEQAGRPLTFSS